MEKSILDVMHETDGIGKVEELNSLGIDLAKGKDRTVKCLIKKDGLEIKNIIIDEYWCEENK